MSRTRSLAQSGVDNGFGGSAFSEVDLFMSWKNLGASFDAPESFKFHCSSVHILTASIESNMRCSFSLACRRRCRGQDLRIASGELAGQCESILSLDRVIHSKRACDATEQRKPTLSQIYPTDSARSRRRDYGWVGPCLSVHALRCVDESTRFVTSLSR